MPRPFNEINFTAEVARQFCCLLIQMALKFTAKAGCGASGMMARYAFGSILAGSRGYAQAAEYSYPLLISTRPVAKMS
ncbi:hypothetical protein [Rosenbergiella nectarea]|uniref:hypothetical protein n=1 Tax=Rosenbergiella nectarea TaxID=988801 RepID=UPI0015A6A929|nr:hypothetical protein [Rosenbergiella nectarea]